MKSIYIFALICTLYSLPLYPQKHSIEKIGITHGLSNSFIRDITFDGDGFLWIATESGLNRFDGNEFKHYVKRRDKQGNCISGNELNKLYADPDTTILWIATQRDGLNALNYRNNTFVHYQKSDSDTGLITNDITDIASSGDGNLWISTYHKCVEHFNKKTQEFTHYNRSTIAGLPEDAAWTVREDKKGNLYIGHVNAGLSIVNLRDKSVTNYQRQGTSNSIAGNSVNAIYIESEADVWIGTENGLSHFNPYTGTFTTFRHVTNRPHSLIANSVRSIAKINALLYIGTENGGVSILNTAIKTDAPWFTNIEAGDGKENLSSFTVSSIIQDTYGNIWIGTYGGGLNFMSHIASYFDTWHYSGNISERTISDKTAWGICTDKDDNFWVGTDGGGIDVIADGTVKKTFNKEKGDLTDNAVLCAMRDSQDNLWFGTFSGGINYYSQSLQRFVTPPVHILKNTTVRCIYEDKQHTVWMGHVRGISTYNLLSKELKTYSKLNDDLPEDDIRSIFRDNDGNIWIGSFGQGLSVFDSDMKLITTFTRDNGFDSNMINHIFGDQKGNVWVATSDGLVLFNNASDLKSYKKFNETNGLTNCFVRAISEDATGNIWLSTNKGISLYLEKENTFHHFGHSFGVPQGNFMSGSVAKSSKGIICFGSENGASTFDSNKMILDITPSPVIVTSLKVYNTQKESAEEVMLPPLLQTAVKLPYNKNTFEVMFNTKDYAQFRITDYSYMLQGVSDQWFDTQGEHKVLFHNVPPGEYRFKVRSRIKNKEWSEKIAEFPLVITPPIWSSWWAKCIYMIIILIIAFSILYFYKRKLELESTLLHEKNAHQKEQELNDERLRFYTNIAHELRTPLTLISGPLDDLYDEQALSEQHRSRIGIIRKSAMRLLKLINEILEFRKVETQNKSLSVYYGDISVTLHDVVLKYKELNKNKEIKIETTSDENIVPIYFDVDIITTILDNLVSNALKYTQSGKVCISLSQFEEEGNQYTEIAVTDTGTGIRKEDIPKLFDRFYRTKDAQNTPGTGIGLALVKKLSIIHQGELFVESEPGVGSIFRFRVFTQNTYPGAKHLSNEVETFTHDEKADDIRTNKVNQIVLVVEDDEDIADYIKDILSNDYQVITANNGEKGIESAFNYIPDLIVSDIMMPVKNGIELCETIKKDIRTSHIPIILLTAKDSTMDRTQGYSSGADSYIVKPFNSYVLRSRISNLLDMRKKLAKQFNEQVIQQKGAIRSESISKMDEEFMNKVGAVIEEHLDSEKMDVNFLAEKMNMSHSTFYRKVKALTGLTANEYIRKIRISHAEQLLLAGKYTISEIAYMAGFNSQTYFRQCFKEEYGMTPSEYIKHIINNSNEK